jgi:hypothetical protein
MVSVYGGMVANSPLKLVSINCSYNIKLPIPIKHRSNKSFADQNYRPRIANNQLLQ